MAPPRTLRANATRPTHQTLGATLMLSALPRSRRDFMRTVAAVVPASALATSATALAEPAGQLGSAGPAPIQPMTLGVFGLDLTFWGIWADLLSPQGRYLGTSALRLRPTHVWDKDVKK